MCSFGKFSWQGFKPSEPGRSYSDLSVVRFRGIWLHAKAEMLTKVCVDQGLDPGRSRAERGPVIIFARALLWSGYIHPIRNENIHISWMSAPSLIVSWEHSHYIRGGLARSIVRGAAGRGHNITEVPNQLQWKIIKDAPVNTYTHSIGIAIRGDCKDAVYLRT